MINRFLSKKLSSFQIICMGFVGVILLGTLLLRLPLATPPPGRTPCSPPPPPCA